MYRKLYSRREALCPLSIRLLISIQFLLKGIAGAYVYAGRTDHLCAKTAEATKINWITFRFDYYYPIAVGTPECIGLLTNTAQIKAIEIAARSEHRTNTKLSLLLLKFQCSS